MATVYNAATRFIDVDHVAVYNPATQMIDVTVPESAFDSATGLINLGAGAAPVPVTRPAIPTGLAASPSTSTVAAIDLSWNAVPGAATYEYRSRIGAGSWTEETGLTATTAVFTGTAGSTYSFQVQARNSAGASGWSTASVTATAPTVVTAPPEPTNVQAAASTTANGAIDVSWTGSDEASLYRIQYRETTTPRGSWSTQTTTGTSDTLTLTADTEYELQVRAENDAGNSDYAPDDPLVVTAPELATEPQVPTGFAVRTSLLRSGTFLSSWDVDRTGTDAAESYQWEWRLPNPDPTKGWTEVAVAAPATGEAQHVFAPATPFSAPTPPATRPVAKTYEFHVLAVNDAGTSGYTSVISVTAEGLDPVEPTSVSAAAHTTINGAITVTWDSGTPSTAQGDSETARIRYREGTSGSWSEVTEATPGGTSARTRTLTGLTAGEDYQIQVRTENDHGESSYEPTTPVTATASQLVVDPGPPTNVRLTASSTVRGQLNLNWTASPTAGVTHEFRRRLDGSWGAYASTDSSTSHTFRGQVGRNYAFQVRSKLGTRVSSGINSSPASITVPELRPGVPPNFKAVASTSTRGRIFLSWDVASRSPTSYQYRQRIRGTGEAGWGAARSTGTTRGATVSGAVGTIFEFQVRALNTHGDGSWSGVTARRAPEIKPAAPVASARVLDRTAGGGGLIGIVLGVLVTGVYIRWVPISNATSYQSQVRRKDRGGAFSSTSSEAQEPFTVSSGSNILGTYWTGFLSRRFRGAVSVTYELRVRARNSEGFSGWSNTVEATMPG